jgi:hypothetical protein
MYTMSRPTNEFYAASPLKRGVPGVHLTGRTPHGRVPHGGVYFMDVYPIGMPFIGRVPYGTCASWVCIS